MTLRRPRRLGPHFLLNLSCLILFGAARDSVPSVALAGSADGTWSAVPPPSARTGHSAIYDPLRRRMIVFGGYDGHRRSDVWSLALTVDPRWSRLHPAGLRPSTLNAHSAFYDPVRDRMVVFGESDDNGWSDTWALSLSDTLEWSKIVPQGALCPGRGERTAIYDPAGDRMIVFGGTDGAAVHDDLWMLPLSGTPVWSALAASGTTPSPRYRHTATYDPVRARMILFGGSDSTSMNDVWTLSLSGTPAWAPLAPTGEAPPARCRHAAIYDEANDRIIVIGGADGEMLYNDVWVLSLSGTPAWSRLAVPDPAPSARDRHTAIYDPVGRQVVLFGGSDGSRENDLWTLSLSGSPVWRHLLPSGNVPTGRVGHSMTYDPARHRMVVFGGYDVGVKLRALSLSGTPAWSGITAVGTPPSDRMDHTAIYDPLRDRIIMFGGFGLGAQSFNDTWALSLSGTPTWNQLSTVGTPPGIRMMHTAIYDPLRDRMLVLGGTYAMPDAQWVPYPNEVWSLSLSGTPTWSKLQTANVLPAYRRGHATIYDPLRDRMVVFGGGGTADGDGVWALSLSAAPTWTQIASTGPPDVGGIRRAIYDPIRDRMIVFGGVSFFRSPGSGSLANDIWSLPFTNAPTWSLLVPSGVPPFLVNKYSVTYDPRNDLVVFFGGESMDPGFANDTWALEFGDPFRPTVACDGDLTWTPGAPLTARYVLTNGLPGDRAIQWVLTGDHDWAGLPLRGIEVLSGEAAETLTVTIPVPDSAVGGTNTLRLSVAYAGAGGNEITCVHSIRAPTTSTLASLISAVADPSRVRLSWHVATSGPVVVYRSSGNGGWAPAAEATVDPTGNVIFEDRNVERGRRYGYRLAWMEGGHELVADEVWVDVPAALEFALHGVRPNPSAGPCAISFTLPRSGRVGLDLFDVNGRRAAARRELEASAGYHVIRLSTWENLAPGVYMVELSFGGRSIRTRTVIVK